MKVLVANSTCKRGGVSTFMLALRSALVSLGHDCELFFFERGTMEPYLPPGVPVHFGSLADCLRLVSRNGFDVVHANNVDWPTGISAVRRVGAKLVLTAHKVRPPAWTYGWTSANCDTLTTVSHDIRGELQPHTDLPIRTVHNGVDVSTFTPAAQGVASGSSPIVAWVGRGASPLKRIDKLADIAPSLHAAGVRLWIIDQHGIDKANESFPEAVRVLRPITERWNGVLFEDMPALYREVAASGGCVLSTSSREGLGLSLLEAQACGCVVIGPNVPGVNEAMSPDHGGVLYEFNASGEDIARAIMTMLRDRSRLAAAQAAAVAFVRTRFSLESMARNYLQLYTEPAASPLGSFTDRLRTRMRLSPMLDWNGYLNQRWGVGHRQYQAACDLLTFGERSLAASTAREAIRTTPTLALHPRRLASLLRQLVT